MTDDDNVQDAIIINNDCTSDTCNCAYENNKTNCSCENCTPVVFTAQSGLSNNIIPLLSNKLVDCINIQKTQYMRSSPITFTIDTRDTVYINNSPIFRFAR